jgi:Tol biopolymer transport system component
MSAAGTGVVAVTHGRVSSRSVAWSPDGRLLAYDLGRPDAADAGAPLVVSRPDGSHLRTITPAKEYADAPAWSPDGRWIAYASAFSLVGTSASDGTIKVVRATGGVGRTVAAPYDGHQPAWSPDGRTLAFAAAWVGGSGIIWATLARPDRPHLLVDCKCETLGSPAWSPDGRSIVFLRSVLDPDLSLVTALGSDLRLQTVRRLPLYTCCLAWWTPPAGQSPAVSYIPQRSAPSSWSSAAAAASVDTAPSPRRSTRTDTVRASRSSTVMLSSDSPRSSVTASASVPERATTS